ncbi:MAG: hypothetical protein SFZ03_10435 [Candidatus Melainabacteria bacterium]|nr:hypothetical protein [Candidatus Melainabacteria bacterium]
MTNRRYGMKTVLFGLALLGLLHANGMALAAQNQPESYPPDATPESPLGSQQLQPASSSQNSRSALSRSRLSQLIKPMAELYLPGQLYLGKDNTFTLRGTPGKKVTVYLSPLGEGGQAPNGQPLRVGPQSQTLTGIISDKGLLQLTLPVPEDKELIGRQLFVDAVLYSDDQFTDLERVDVIDASGRRGGANSLSLAEPVEVKKGPMLFPGVPGMSPQVLQNLTNVSNAINGDERKKELLDLDGQMERGLTRDRNPFVQLPGTMPGGAGMQP